MHTAPMAAPAASPTQRQGFAPWQSEELRRLFGARDARYVERVLTPNEVSVLADLSDALIIARIKRMKCPRLKRFDTLFPANRPDQRLYRTLQARWLCDEEYLLGTRLGRSPSPKELFRDFTSHHHGLRFRAYFAMKYPERVMRCGPQAKAADQAHHPA